MNEHDIDLSGSDEDDLPPGVSPGSLSGDDGPTEEEDAARIAEEQAAKEALADELADGDQQDAVAEERADDAFEADVLADEQAEESDDPSGGFDPNGQGAALDAQLDAAVTADEPVVEPQPEPETLVQPPKPKRKTAAKKKPAAKKPPKAAKPPANGRKPTVSGPIDRTYLIFAFTQTEIDGNVIEVPVQQSFEIDGNVVNGIVARNRDLALTRVARLYGEGFEGTLVAVPESMWEPKPVSNRPKSGFVVQIGEAA